LRRFPLLGLLFCLPAVGQLAPATSSQPPSHQQLGDAPQAQWASQLGFSRYAEDNRRIAKQKTSRPIVLMGDSITDFWIRYDPELFEDGNIIDRRISGQTTMQILLRFRADVVALHPKAVVILAGINDLAQNQGKESLELIEGNLQSMAEIGQASGIRVLFCSLPPSDHFAWRPGIAPTADIRAINLWMKSYALAHHLVYIDYFSALAGPGNTIPPAYSLDGVHPTKAGYVVMRRELMKGIDASRHTQSK